MSARFWHPHPGFFLIPIRLSIEEIRLPRPLGDPPAVVSPAPSTLLGVSSIHISGGSLFVCLSLVWGCLYVGHANTGLENVFDVSAGAD